MGEEVAHRGPGRLLEIVVDPTVLARRFDGQESSGPGVGSVDHYDVIISSNQSSPAS
jgi:hypothetical protein